MKNPKVTMLDRYTVRFENEAVELEFEVEPLTNGVVLYRANPKILRGEIENFEQETNDVIKWLQSKFSKVKVNLS